MADFIRRHSLLISSLILFIVSCQLMSASIENNALPRMGGRVINSLTSPVEQLFHETFETAAYIWDRYFYLVGLEARVGELENQVKALESKNSELLEYETENKALRRILRFEKKTDYQGVVASVIGRDPSNWVRTITIDRGLEDGVKPGMAVADGHAVVGQTTVVSGSSSKVLLLSDHTSAIDAIVQGSRAPGIVEGSIEENLSLEYVLKEFPIRPGDRVITSGLDGVYPKGLRIGVVTNVNPNKASLFQSVEIEPTADLNRLEDVLVLIPGAAGRREDASAVPATDTDKMPAAAPAQENQKTDGAVDPAPLRQPPLAPHKTAEKQRR